jgi:hypothetical protein
MRAAEGQSFEQQVMVADALLLWTQLSTGCNKYAGKHTAKPSSPAATHAASPAPSQAPAQDQPAPQVSHHAHTNLLLLLLLLLIQQNLMIQPEALITVNIGTFNTATQPHLLLRMLPPLQSPSQAPIPDQPPPLASHHAHKKTCCCCCC